MKADLMQLIEKSKRVTSFLFNLDIMMHQPVPKDMHLTKIMKRTYRDLFTM